MKPKTTIIIQKESSGAFTLVEMMVVVTIIAILAGLVTFAATSIQRSTRDSAREAKVRVITEALEKYYTNNGEYPSVAFMTGSDVNAIKQKLGITDAATFKFPNSSSANSITTSSPSTTGLQYLASTTDTTKNSQCQTDVNGYCDAYQLKYVKETDNTTVIINSKHSDFVALTESATPTGPINYSDDFASSGVLGTVKTGSPSLTWLFFNSTSSNWSRNTGGYATTTVAAASNPMAVANFSTSDVSITEGVRSTGNAIYFRVVDGDDWLRARVNKTTSTYQSGTSYTYDCSSDGFDGQPDYTDATGSGSFDCSYVGLGSSNLLSTSPMYQTSTNFSVVLEKSVSGTVTQLDGIGTGSSAPAFIKVVAKGTSIKTFHGSTSSTPSAGSNIVDTTNQSATLHGVGYAASSVDSPTGITSFAIVNAP